MKHISIICAALMAGSTIMAQQQTGPDRERSRDSRPQERLRQERRMERPGALTEEQREKVQEVTGKTREKQRELAEKMRSLRQELDELVRAEKVDEAAVRAKGTELGQVEAELALIRGQHYRELKGVLSEEQLNAVARPGFGPGVPGGAYGQRAERVVTRPQQDAPRAVPSRPIPPGRRGAEPDRGE